MFPPISWWHRALAAPQAAVGSGDVFYKGSLYNRYRIVAANGPMWLTVPLAGGRLQHQPVSRLQISYSERWQHRHAHTLISAYGRAPFFEALWFLFEPLYQQRYEWLSQFNEAALAAAARALRVPQQWPVSDIVSTKTGPPDDAALPVYQQVFAARHGFHKDLSILDLIFCKGKY